MVTDTQSKSPLDPPSDGFCVALSRRCLLVRRLLGETLFKGVDGHLEIIAPLDQGPCQDWILDIRPVGNAGALFLGRDLAFDQLNGADKISQYLTNHCSFARCLKTRLYTHLDAPNDLVRHTQRLVAERLKHSWQVVGQ